MAFFNSAAKKAFDAYKKENGSDKTHQRAERRVCDAPGTKEKFLCRIPQDQIGNVQNNVHCICHSMCGRYIIISKRMMRMF